MLELQGVVVDFLPLLQFKEQQVQRQHRRGCRLSWFLFSYKYSECSQLGNRFINSMLEP